GQRLGRQSGEGVDVEVEQALGLRGEGGQGGGCRGDGSSSGWADERGCGVEGGPWLNPAEVRGIPAAMFEEGGGAACLLPSAPAGPCPGSRPAVRPPPPDPAAHPRRARPAPARCCRGPCTC